MNFKMLSPVILLVFSALPAFANRESGGGDPLAIEFIQISQAVSKILPAYPAPGEISKNAFDSAVGEVRTSLGGVDPLVQFPAGETISCFRAPKLGCVPGDGKIYIARQGWLNSPVKQRIELTIMEMSLLAGNGKARYEFANDLASKVLSAGFDPKIPTDRIPVMNDVRNLGTDQPGVIIEGQPKTLIAICDNKGLRFDLNASFGIFGQNLNVNIRDAQSEESVFEPRTSTSETSSDYYFRNSLATLIISKVKITDKGRLVGHLQVKSFKGQLDELVYCTVSQNL